MAVHPASFFSKHTDAFFANRSWPSISTRAHGVFDYVMGFVLIGLPFLPNFPRADANAWATWTPVTLGMRMLLYSSFTRYECGFLRWLPMPAHLALDGFGALLLSASPWLFHFQSQVYRPHLWLGVLELGVVIRARARPFPARARRDTNLTPINL